MSEDWKIIFHIEISSKDWYKDIYPKEACSNEFIQEKLKDDLEEKLEELGKDIQFDTKELYMKYVKFEREIESKSVKLFSDYGKWGKGLDDFTKDDIIKTITKEIEALKGRCNFLFPIYHEHFVNIDEKLLFGDWNKRIEALESEINTKVNVEKYLEQLDMLTKRLKQLEGK